MNSNEDKAVKVCSIFWYIIKLSKVNTLYSWYILVNDECKEVSVLVFLGEWFWYSFWYGLVND